MRRRHCQGRSLTTKMEHRHIVTAKQYGLNSTQIVWCGTHLHVLHQKEQQLGEGVVRRRHGQGGWLGGAVPAHVVEYARSVVLQALVRVHLSAVRLPNCAKVQG
jgi:hypothetical protein